MTKNHNLLHEKYQVLENDNKYGFKLYKDGLNEKVNCWHLDGTFAVCPDLFYQLYTINGLINGKNLPLLFALLPG